MAKYLQIHSDLHLEAFIGMPIGHFIPPHENDPETILVLAGDISSIINALPVILSDLCARFAAVIYVPGNHEAYRFDLVSWSVYAKQHFDKIENLFWTDLTTTKRVSVLGHDFILSTMWADCGVHPIDTMTVNQYLNDFNLIRVDDRKLTTYQFKQMHCDAVRDIAAELDNGPAIVVTHHLPSRVLVSARFWPVTGGDGANGGFASNSDHLIDHDNTRLWIFGHTHDFVDRELYETRVVCNPTGYRGEWNKGFAGGERFIIELSDIA